MTKRESTEELTAEAVCDVEHAGESFVHEVTTKKCERMMRLSSASTESHYPLDSLSNDSGGNVPGESRAQLSNSPASLEEMVSTEANYGT